MISVIVPCLNEEKHIVKAVNDILSLDLADYVELIVVDNGSTDYTVDLVKQSILEFQKNPKENYSIKFVREFKKGKANAVRKGLGVATGDIIIFQDADNEYDAKNIVNLVDTIKNGYDGAVGMRMTDFASMSIGSFVANKFFVYLIKKFYKINVPDVLSGQRAYRKSILDNIKIASMGFDMEIELTIKTIYNSIKYIPVLYIPRSKLNGKKIRAKDFFVILSFFIKNHNAFAKNQLT